MKSGNPRRVSREFKVLLVYANSFMDTLFPVSISSISGALNRIGVQTKCFDTTFYPDYIEGKEHSSDVAKAQNLQVLSVNYEDVGITPKTTNVLEDFRQTVKEFKPDLIGVSVVEPTFLLGMRLLEAVEDTKIPTIVGGVHAIFAPESVMAYSAVNMVCIGEGEECIVDLCLRMASGDDYTDVENIWLRKNGSEIIKNKKSEVQHLDNLPRLDFSVFEPERIFRPMSGKLWKMVPIEFSRGCIYKCTYCSAPAFMEQFKDQGNWLRQKSLDQIFDEIRYYRDEFGVEYFYFVSETFLAIPKKRLFEFLERYKDIGIPFWFNTRAETIKNNVVQALEEVGCHRVSIGLECGNAEYRSKMLQRPVSNEKTIQACEEFEFSAIELSVNNIIGYPEENRELIFETIELNRQVEKFVAAHSCSIFQPYKGTWLYEYCVKKGYWNREDIANDLNFDPAIQYPEITHEELKGLHRTFPFYVKFPKDDWGLIRLAEGFDLEGEAAYKACQSIYYDRYFNSNKTHPRFLSSQPEFSGEPLQST